MAKAPPRRGKPKPSAKAPKARAPARKAAPAGPGLARAAKPARRGARGFVGRKATPPIVRRDEAPARKAPRKGKGRRETVVGRTDEAVPAVGRIRVQNRPDEVHRNTADRRAFHAKDYEAFFQAEIEAELAEPAEIFNDRIARWRCQCCDAVIPVPRRTTVFHGEFVLEHDDVEGLLVNGEKFVPRASGTPLEVVQPGRLRNPFTGRTLEDEAYQPVDLS